MKAVSNPFHLFRSLGYSRFVPIVPPNANVSEKSSLYRAVGKDSDPRGKAVGVKGADGKWRGFDWRNYESDDSDLTRWHAMGAGVGIRTGGGLVLVDADTMDEGSARIIRDVLAKHVDISAIRVGRYPKAGYLVRTDADFRYCRIEFGKLNEKGALADRVEILAEGRQFVAHGVHPKTNKLYDWPRGIPEFAKLPFVKGSVLLDALAELRSVLPTATPVRFEGVSAGSAEIDQTALAGDLETVRAAVAATPNTSALFPTRESYRDFGYAIKAALPNHEDEAFGLFSDWCARWQDGDNDADVVASDWRRMKPPFRRGAGWLYDLAEGYSGGAFSTAKVWFDDLGEAPSLADELNGIAGNTEHNKDLKPPKFVFQDFASAADLALEQSNKPLIKGLLDCGTMSVMYGDSNVGKTFVAMDLAFHIAAGLNYAGMRTTQGLVVYVAAEGGNGARKRVRALREKYGVEACSGARFALLASPVDFRRPDADLKPFVEALRGLGERPALIVVDTLSRAMAGGDENSSVDMGALVRNFDALRGATGAHLLIVHHTGKNKANGARGHSLLRAATDTEIEIEEGLVSVTKQRDLDKSWTSAFALEVVTLGVDNDLDAVTSCTVSLMTATQKKALEEGAGVELPLTSIEETVVECLAEACEGISTGINVEQLMAYSGDRLSKIGGNSLRVHLQNAKAKGHIVQPKRGFWAAKERLAISCFTDPKRFSGDEEQGKARNSNTDIFA